MSSNSVSNMSIVISIICVIGSFVLGNKISGILDMLVYGDAPNTFLCALPFLIASFIGVLPLFIFAKVLENQEEMQRDINKLKDKSEKEDNE